jgi:hypothetical protein
VEGFGWPVGTGCVRRGGLGYVGIDGVRQHSILLAERVVHARDRPARRGTGSVSPVDGAGFKALGPCEASACATSGGMGRRGTRTLRGSRAPCCNARTRGRARCDVACSIPFARV